MSKLLLYFFFFLNLAVISFFWWSNSGSLFISVPNSLIALGRVAGLLATVFVLMQFVLIGRAPWVERVFGLDNLSRIHRLNGYWLLVTLLLHPTLIILGYSLLSNTSFISQFMTLVTSYEYVLGAFIAFCLFIIIVFSSIYIVRRKLRYEYWYAVHLLTYLAVFFVFGHQTVIGEDFLANKLFTWYWFGLYIFVLGNHLIFRFLRPWVVFFKHRFKVSKVVPEANKTNSVYITGQNLADFKIKAGQFMILRFLDKQRWYEAHPFSLSDYPNDKYLRITPKEVGDFTSEIKNLRPGTPVIIDGPLGSFTDQVRTKRKVLMIAGGVGVTPLRSLTEQFLKQKLDIIFLYGNRNSADILFKQEFLRLQKRFSFKLIDILSNEPKFKGEKGYIDEEKIVRLVKDVTTRDVFLCGPVVMMKKVEVALHLLGVPKSQIHYEKFSL